MIKKKVDKSYYKYFDGRPNIFIIFIIKSLLLLNENGFMIFVLPKSFNNSLYYNKTREFINNNYTIITIENCDDDDFLETKQETIILFIQNKKPSNNNDFVLNINNYIIFSSKRYSLKNYIVIPLH